MSTKNGPFLEQVLYENAIDFINKSMESYLRASEDEDKKEYKYAILFLATGTELILKSVLQNKHPLFVFRDIDSGDEKTVAAEKLIPRINRVYTDEKKRIQRKDIDNFNSIRESRNSIMHKDVRFDSPPEQMYARTLYSLDRVVKEFLEKTLHDEVKNWSYIIDSEVIRREYYTDVIGFKIEGLFIPCSLCSLEKLTMEKGNSGSLICFHCNQKYDSVVHAINSVEDIDKKEELFVAYTSSLIKKGVEISNCPSCGNADYLHYDPEVDCLICFDCGVIQSDNCPKCSKNSTYFYEYDDGEATFCVNCQDNPLHKCDMCDDDDYDSAGKFTIDIRKPKSFERAFPNHNLTGALPVVELCQKCMRNLYHLESKDIVTIT